MGELAWHSAAKHAAATEEFESAAVARGLSGVFGVPPSNG